MGAERKDVGKMNKRENIMLCYPLEEKRLIKWGPPYIVQPKLDGDRCRCVIDELGGIELISSEGNPRNQSVPHIVKDIQNLLSEGILSPPIELDGELYIHEGGYHELIHGIVSRTRNLHPDYKRAQYHIFDIVDETQPSIFRVKTLEFLRNLPSLGESIRIVFSLTVPTIQEVLDYVDPMIEQGYEGIIIRRPLAMYERKRSTNIMKFKPRKEDTYSIVDTIEEMSIDGMPKNSLGALVLVSDDGKEAFKVGSGSFLTQDRRKELWKVRDKLPGKTAVIKYQRMSAGRRVPVFPVLIDIK